MNSIFNRVGFLLIFLSVFFLDACKREGGNPSSPVRAEGRESREAMKTDETCLEFRTGELRELAAKGAFSDGLRIIQDRKDHTGSADWDLQALFERWCEVDSHEALDACLSLPERQRQLILGALIAHLAEFDPGAAWELVQKIPDERMRKDSLESCASEIAHRDWREALRLLSQGGKSEESDMALSLGFAMGVRGHLNDFANRGDLPELEQVLKDLLSGRGTAEFHDSLRGSLVEALGRISVATNEDWSEAPPLASDAKERARFSSGVARELISRFQGAEAQGAAVILRNGGPVAQAVLPEYIDKWARDSPLEATEFFLREPEFKSGHYVEKTFSIWLDSDVSSAAGWLARQEPGPATDPLIVNLVGSLVNLGERSLAASWSDSISQPSLREQCIERHGLSDPSQ